MRHLLSAVIRRLSLQDVQVVTLPEQVRQVLEHSLHVPLVYSTVVFTGHELTHLLSIIFSFNGDEH